MRKWFVWLAVVVLLFTISGCGIETGEVPSETETVCPTTEATEPPIQALDSIEYWEIVQDEILSMLKEHNLYLSATTHGYPCKQFHVEPGIATDDGKVVASGLSQEEYEKVFESVKVELHIILDKHKLAKPKTALHGCYSMVDIFNWQEEAAGMISQMEFVRRVDVQTETIERYVREGKLIPDLVVPMSEHRTFKYFKEESLEKYAQQYGWRLIDDSNRKDLFMEMIRQMDMSYSYKPVLIQAILLYADDKGRVKLDDIVSYFRSFYEGRRAAGLPVEKKNSIFSKGGYTDADAKRNILSNPFKRFEDMQMLRHTKTLGIIQVEETVWKHLSAEEKDEIGRVCGEKLEAYYSRLK